MGKGKNDFLWGEANFKKGEGARELPTNSNAMQSHNLRHGHALDCYYTAMEQTNKTNK